MFGWRWGYRLCPLFLSWGPPLRRRPTGIFLSFLVRVRGVCGLIQSFPIVEPRAIKPFLHPVIKPGAIEPGGNNQGAITPQGSSHPFHTGYLSGYRFPTDLRASPSARSERGAASHQLPTLATLPRGKPTRSRTRTHTPCLHVREVRGIAR